MVPHEACELTEKWGKPQWKETFILQEELKTCWNVSLCFLPCRRRAGANPSSSKTPHILTFCRSPWHLKGIHKALRPRAPYHFVQVVYVQVGFRKRLPTHRTHKRQQQTCKYYANVHSLRRLSGCNPWLPVEHIKLILLNRLCVTYLSVIMSTKLTSRERRFWTDRGSRGKVRGGHPKNGTSFRWSKHESSWFLPDGVDWGMLKGTLKSIAISVHPAHCNAVLGLLKPAVIYFSILFWGRLLIHSAY